MTSKNIKRFAASACACAMVFAVGLSACGEPEENEGGSQFTITVDYNDGTSRPGMVFVDEGGSIQAPDAEREGYQVEYWSTDEEGEERVTFPYTPEGNVTLYAQWQAAQYTVTFDYGIAGEDNYTAEVEYNQTITPPAEADYPVNEGYTLFNWLTAKENGTAVTFPYTVTGDVTFYANWVSDEQGLYTVSIDVNTDELDTEYDPITVVGGDKVTSSQLPNLRRELPGYTFNGWSLTPDAAADDVIELPYVPEGDVTLYANWSQMQLTVRYSYNDFTHEDGYSGASNGASIIRPDTDGRFNAKCEGKPNGYYVSYLFKKGATLTFNIHSDKAVDNVTLYAALGLEWLDDVTFSSDESNPYCYQFIVNGKSVEYTLHISGLANVGESGAYSSPIAEYKIGSISLKEGDNVIQLVTNNSTNPGGTATAMAPSVDYIRIDGYGDAKLSWHPELDSLNRKLAGKN